MKHREKITNKAVGASDGGLQFRESYSLLDQRIRRVTRLTAILIYLTEFIIIIVDLLIGKIVGFEQTLQFLFKYMIKTFLIVSGSQIAIWGMKKHLDHARGGNKRKTDINYIRSQQVLTCMQFVAVVTAVSVVHYNYPAMYTALAFPMYLSVIYADKKVFNAVAGISFAIQVIGFYLTHGAFDVLPEQWYMNSGLGVMFFIASYIICFNILSVEGNKEKEQEDLEKAAKNAETLSEKDGLTGLWNIKRIEREIGVPVSALGMAMIDIDDFKQVNDEYGHDFGNVVLMRLANILKNLESDRVTACRFGGEEFCMIFRDMSLEEICNDMNNLRDKFEHQHYRETGGKSITFSCGVATMDMIGKRDGKKLLDRADSALYISKRSGKNKVTPATEEAVAREAEKLEKKLQEKVSLGIEGNIVSRLKEDLSFVKAKVYEFKQEPQSDKEDEKEQDLSE